MPKVIVEPGTVLLEKYIVDRVIGKGGMGIVAAARHMELGELFAIKLLLESDLEQTEPIERFLREARACARLKSEHAVRVHDFGRLPTGTPYMVMEYLAGQDLRQILQTRGMLAIDEAVQYVLETCEAVAEAHAMGIVHRDLKPANLFLARRPAGPPIIKVLDFGISKELDPQERVGADLTRTGALLGSPNYMSPEQMTHVKATDARSDIWSLGVVLFQLVTGKLPFQGTVLTEVIARVLTQDVPRPSTFRTDIPPDLETIVLRCLEKSPENRFQSVNELVKALGMVLSKEPPRIRATEFSLADTLKRPSLEEGGASPIASPLTTRTPSMHATLSETEVPTRNAWGQEATEKNLRRNKQGIVAFFAAATVLVGGSLYVMIGTNSETPAASTGTTATSATSATTSSEMVHPAAISVNPIVLAPASASASTPVISGPRNKPRPARPTTTTGRNLPGFDD